MGKLKLDLGTNRPLLCCLYPLCFINTTLKCLLLNKIARKWYAQRNILKQSDVFIHVHKPQLRICMDMDFHLYIQALKNSQNPLIRSKHVYSLVINN